MEGMDSVIVIEAFLGVWVSTTCWFIARITRG
jgi:hypothetical protein